MNNKHSFPMAFINAFNGVYVFLKNDRNGRIHLFVAICVVCLSFALKVTIIEWLALLLCIALVLTLEMMNAAMEYLCDMVHKDFHPVIGIIKDVCAGAVLLASIISAIIGCIIFIPKIIALL